MEKDEVQGSKLGNTIEHPAPDQKSFILPSIGAVDCGAVVILFNGGDFFSIVNLFFGQLFQQNAIERWAIEDDCGISSTAKRGQEIKNMWVREDEQKDRLSSFLTTQRLTFQSGT